MGGNLFKLGRLPRQEYLAIESEVVSSLHALIPGQFLIPRYYSSKPDFGDLDVLVSSAALPGGKVEIREAILRALGISIHKNSGHILSTVHREFQVDFFFVPPEELQSTFQFLCYNDLGNILGKLFRRCNLKYGEGGLFYVHRRDNDDHFRLDVLLTQDMGRILGFLGLDFQRWDAGFERLEDMFAWVTGSPYFSVRPFLERSASTERRVEKRTTMERFVHWLEENSVSKAYPFPEDRSIFIPRIFEAFPEADLPGILASDAERHRLEQRVHAKFNGRLLMDMFPELAGPELGAFIQYFKSHFRSFEAEIDSMESDAVNQALVDAHRRFRLGRAES